MKISGEESGAGAQDPSIDERISRMRAAGFSLAEIGGLLDPPVTKQRVWERLNRFEAARIARRRRGKKAKAAR